MWMIGMVYLCELRWQLELDYIWDLEAYGSTIDDWSNCGAQNGKLFFDGNNTLMGHDTYIAIHPVNIPIILWETNNLLSNMT